MEDSRNGLTTDSNSEKTSSSIFWNFIKLAFYTFIVNILVVSESVCPQLGVTWKRTKVKAHHEKESCQTGLVGPKNVSLLEQYQKMVSVGPKKLPSRTQN